MTALAVKLGSVRRLLRRHPERWTLPQATRVLERAHERGTGVVLTPRRVEQEIASIDRARNGDVTVHVGPAALGALGSALELLDHEADAAALGQAIALERRVIQHAHPEWTWERSVASGECDAFVSELLEMIGLPAADFGDVPRDAIAGLAGLLLRGAACDVATACSEWFGVPVKLGVVGRGEGTRLWVGPLTWARFTAFLPESPDNVLRSLLQVAALFLGPRGLLQVVLVLEASEVPPCRLGTPSATLGRSAWLASGRRRNALCVIECSRHAPSF